MMRTEYRVEGARACFVIADLDAAYHEVARALGFERMDNNFARCFPVDTPRIERAYANFARRAEDLVLQKAGESPVPGAQALETFLRRIDGAGIDWFLAGSAALTVRGLDIAPGDIDLTVAGPDARRLGDLLLNDLIEPVAPVKGWVCDWWGRSFPGACLEWAGGVDERVDTPAPSDFGPIAARRLETVEWRGWQLRIPPLDLQLAVSERRGRTERAELIRRAMQR